MQLTKATYLALAAVALALPPNDKDELVQNPIDPDLASKGACGILKKPVCCRQSHLGLIDTGCSAAAGSPKTGQELATACEATGKLARCCVLGLLGLYLACMPPKAVATELGWYDDYTPPPSDITLTVTQ
ncbi:hydrophobin [Diaporthe amygdali]|uniref:hydrophobin n=1 Tax=Phomopsis amygdali TaxID=1214568 RepID=UPI0022FE7AAE|nr:hydrophobin [Diaporthe amygdali]KAJ0119427.1 hydrophobin [Diaporthe amygdali]